jgi:hypothetical protein
MIIKSKMRALLAGAMFCAAGIVTAQALPSTFVTFSVDMSTNILLGTFVQGVDAVNVRGTYNGWAATETPLVQVGSTTVYTNTVNDTNDANGGAVTYIFNIDGTTYETLPTHINGSNNRQSLLPTTSGASLVLPTSYFADAGALVSSTVKFQVDMAQQIVLGNFSVANSTNINVRGTIFGNFNDPTPYAPVYTLTNDPSIITTDNLGVTHSNVYVGTWPVTNSPGAFVEFKFTFTTAGNTSWDAPAGVNADGGGNRYFANVSQTLPIVLFNDVGAAYPCTNVFQVDMSGPAANDPSYDPTSVILMGSFNGWGSAIPMTNNINAGNTNLFTTSLPVVVGQGSTITGYQFRYTDSGGTVYDHAPNGQNRTLTVPLQPNYLVPWVYFLNAGGSDSLSQPMQITFSIDMTGAVATDSTVWAPGSAVFVNGPWPNWLPWNPLSLSGQELTEVGSTPIYTGTVTIAAGNTTSLTYKYSLGGPDNEAGQDINLIRVIRTTATGAYSFPQDKWQNQYQEPSFGQLAVGSASGGKVALSWLGRPGCQVQTSPSLTSPTWVSYPNTDGTNWTLGTVSTNGLLSATNWPVSTGNLFFRLIKH